MAKGKRKLDAKAFAQQKRHRRQWVTFIRMCRYGVNNFSRNAWLTIAATAVMTITLLVIFTSVMARNILVDTLTDLQAKVNMSVYLTNETSPQNAQRVADDIGKLSTVQAVEVVSPDNARNGFIQQNREDNSALEAIREATNKFPWTINIQVADINDTSELSEFVAANELTKQNLDPNRPPSFAGTKRATIETIGRAIDFAQRIGVITSAVFVVISMLIIFNTIRMAIFNRREEITMMKLIGAERSFIRGPFIVEAIVYGFFAALIATGIGYTMLYFAAPALASYQINVQPTSELMTVYIAFVLLAMIAVGAIIGIVSSLLATRRYLKL